MGNKCKLCGQDGVRLVLGAAPTFQPRGNKHSPQRLMGYRHKELRVPDGICASVTAQSAQLGTYTSSRLSSQCWGACQESAFETSTSR